MAEYAVPFSGPDQREFARRRSVINSIRAAKIRERRVARKRGDHGRDAEILLEGQRAGIPYGGHAYGKNLDQLALSQMYLDRDYVERKTQNRANQHNRRANAPKVPTKPANAPRAPRAPRAPEVPTRVVMGDDSPSEQETNINVPGQDMDAFVGWLRENPEARDRFVGFLQNLNDDEYYGSD